MNKSITTSLAALGLHSIVSLTLVGESQAANYQEALKCQKALLAADLRQTKCRERCARQYRAGCESKCEKSFARSAQKPLSCIGERIIRHVRVSANAGWVDTGLYVPEYGFVSIVAVGSWTYMPGGPAVGSEGTPNTENDPRMVAPDASVGELVLKDGVFKYGVGHPYEISYDIPEPRRIFLAMNDMPSGYYDNTGYLDVSVMVDGLTKAEVTVPANTWVDSKIFKGPDSHVRFQEISGAWTNVVGGPMLGAAGYAGYRYPGTILPNADLAALAGSIGSTYYWIGTGGENYTPHTNLGSFRFGMNDVAGGLHDNSGQIKLVIESGGWTVN